jgi:DNA-binding GntR family transcriptional regulator
MTQTDKTMARRTQADMIREAIADRIVHGILLPGEPLDEAGLAGEFGVSRTPVREAIRQLESIGLALSRPHRGAVVTTLTEAEFQNIFLVMAELETLAARLCATAMTDDERCRLEALHSSGEALVAAGEVERYRSHNDRFHDAIYGGSHNGFLEETARSVRRRVAPFRRLQFDADRRIDRSQEEHGRVVAAILAGDGGAAAEAMGIHMRIVGRTVGDVSGGLADRKPRMAPPPQAADRSRLVQS